MQRDVDHARGVDRKGRRPPDHLGPGLSRRLVDGVIFGADDDGRKEAGIASDVHRPGEERAASNGEQILEWKAARAGLGRDQC